MSAEEPVRAESGATGWLEKLVVGALLVVLLLVPVQRWGRIVVFEINVQVSDFVLALAAGGFLIGLVTGAFRLRRTGLEWALALYPLAAVLSLVNAPSVTRTLVKTAGILSLVLTAYLVMQVFHTPRRRRLVVDTWLVGTALVTALTFVGVVGFFAVGPDFAVTRWTSFSLGSLPDAGFPRVSGSFVIGNMYCNYLLFSAALLYGAWPDLQRRVGGLVLVGFAGILAVSVLFTLSTGWGGFALGAIVLCYARRPGVWRWLRPLRPLVASLAVGLTAFLVFITVVTLVPKGYGEPLLGPLGDVLWEPSGRLLGWASSLETIGEHPLFGKGAGEFVSSFWHQWAMQGSDGGPVWRFYTLEAHNIWLGLWGQMGALGIGAFAGLVFTLLRGTLRAPEGRWRTALLAGLVGGLVFHGLFASLEDARYLWVFFAWTAIATAPRGSELGAPQDEVGQQAHES